MFSDASLNFSLLAAISKESWNWKFAPTHTHPRGWAEPEPKLCARTEILVFVWILLEIPAFQFQLSGTKPEEHPFTFTFTWNFLDKYIGRIYSSCFLPDSCNRNADISGSLQTKTRILILTQSSYSGSVQPLPSSPGSHPKLLPFVKSKSCRSPGGAKNKGGGALIFGGFDLLKDQKKVTIHSNFVKISPKTVILQNMSVYAFFIGGCKSQLRTFCSQINLCENFWCVGGVKG